MTDKATETPQAAPAVGAQPEPGVRPRTCRTCAHRNGTLHFGRCMRTGYYLETERRFPQLCGKDFEGWVQREPLTRRIAAWLYAA